MQYSTTPTVSGDKAPERSGAALLPVTTTRAAPARPSVNAEAFIEISFMGATIRVRGAVDSQVLGVVFDCLAQRV